MTDKNPAELSNQRYLMMLTNDNAAFQPLVILVPQWAKASLDTMSKQRQQEIYERFAHELGEAWEKLLREV